MLKATPEPMSLIDTNQPDRQQVISVRAVFLSDFHFGYKGVDGRALLNFLQSYAPQKIYLVGDIIDGWKLAKRWHWRADYTRILDVLADHKQRGAKIIYLPGNHDERVRRLNRFRRARFSLRAGIRICNSCIHRTLDGKRLIVLHGDQFDNVLIRGHVSRFGDWFYEHIANVFGLTAPAPRIMIDGKMKKYSLAKALMKRSGKAALRLLNNFQRAAYRLMIAKGADGLICGHTHVPFLRMIRHKKILGNCGMWMGHTNTALIENMDGKLELLHFPDQRDQDTAEDVSITHVEAMRIARHRNVAFIIRKIAQTWPEKTSQAFRVNAQAAQRQKRIIDQVGGYGVNKSGEAAFGCEITA